MDNKRIKINLILCSMMHGLNHYIVIFFKPMYPMMAGYFGLEKVAEVTTRLVIIYLGYGLSNFLTGLLARKVSLKMMLFYGMLLMSVATILFSFIPADQYHLAVICVFFIGLGGGTYHPAANTLMTRLYETRQGHAIGMLSIGSALGFVTAPLIGTYIGRDAIGFQNLFLLSGILVFIFNLVFLVLVKDAPPLKKDGENKSEGKKNHSVSMKVMVFTIIFLCIPTMIRDFISWGYFEITPFWVNNGFSSAIGIGIIQLMAYLPGPVVQPLAGRLCDKFGSMRILVITFLLASVGHAFLALISPLFAWLGLILYGIGMSASTVASETYMASIVSVKNRALVYGIVLSVALGVGGFLSGFSGSIVDYYGKTNAQGYQIWFFGMAAIMGLSVLFYPMIKLIRRKKIKK